MATDLFGDFARCLMIGSVLYFLWNFGRQRGAFQHRGWNYILSGLGMILMGGFWDLSGNFPELEQFFEIGLFDIRFILENFFGYLGGLFLVGLGLYLFLPLVDLVFLDNQERKISEEALRFDVDRLDSKVQEQSNRLAEANTRLVNAVEGLNDIFSLWDENDRLVFGNRAFRELNKDFPEVLAPGTPFEAYLRAGIAHGHMRDLTNREEGFLQQSLERRQSINAEPFEIERADGTVIRLHEQKLEGGGIVTVGQDVTEQRQSEMALRASQERLALAVEQLSVWDWDVVADDLYMSPGFAAKLGYEPDEFAAIKEVSITQIIHPQDVDQYRAKLTAHLENPSRAFSNEHRFKTKSGDYRWFLAIGQSVNQAGKTVRSTGVLTDITDRVELEGRLQQAQKMEAIGSLTGGVAHDFNNLLAIILGNLELIREVGSNDDIMDLVDSGILATQRGADLVKSMLSFSQQSRLQPKAVNLNALLVETQSWFARVLPENIALVVSTSECLLRVEIDPALAQSAILNLCVNAKDAMPNGGRLLITTENLVVNKAHYDALGECVEPGKYVVLTIEDTGEGIPESNLKNIFQPFFTTKPPGSGSGLGLSMVQGFMRQSGGVLQVFSEPNQGATFKLVFNAKDSDEATSTEAAGEDRKAFNLGARILLVEDEAAVLGVLKATLTQAGYETVTAQTGDEALKIVERDEFFDLLITDIVMPGLLQGFQLAEAIKELHPEVPIIFLSGYSESTTENYESTSSLGRRLAKPLKRLDLLNAVEKALSI